jgi:hypothetical protein
MSSELAASCRMSDRMGWVETLMSRLEDAYEPATLQGFS